MTALVSVVVPTHNRKHTLHRCLSALFRQGYPRYEVIVVDDGSTDGTADMVRRRFPRARCVVHQLPRGPAAARNSGARVAVGDVIAFLDDDCLPPPCWLTRLVNAFRCFPEAAIICGFVRPSRRALRSHPLARYEWFLTHTMYGLGDHPKVRVIHGLGAGNMAIRAPVFHALQGFDESFPVAAGEDTDLLRRATLAGYTVVHVPVPVLHLQPYTWSSFLRQQVRRGIGAAYYHTKWQERRPLAWEVLRLPLIFPGVWLRETIRHRDVTIAFVHAVAVLCQAIGRVTGYARLLARPHAPQGANLGNRRPFR